MMNTRRCRYRTLDGEHITMKQMAAQLAMNHVTLRLRLRAIERSL